jgi:ribosomal protein S3
VISITEAVVTLGVCGVVGWLMWGVKSPPKTMEENTLEEEGMGPQDIRRELRAQRAEHRQHSTTKSQAMRALYATQRTLSKTFK